MCAENWFIILVFLLLSPGCALSVFMFLCCLKYKNLYFGLFSMTYISTGIMAFTMHINQNSIEEDNFWFNLIGLLCIFGIIESGTWLVARLFYDRLHIILSICIVIVGALPVTSYVLAGILFRSHMNMVYYFSFLYFFGILTADCIVFALNFRKIGHQVSRKFGVTFCIYLLAFLAIFFTQWILEINFNPLYIFYFLWSVLLIWFSWKHILSDGLNKLFHVQESFVKRFNITKREEEIIELVVQGHKNSKIGEQLFISEKTVTNHIYNIYKKLGINSRFELICLFKK